MDDNKTASFSLDSRRAATTGRDDFERSWRTHVGDGFPLPRFSAATTADFRLRFRAAKVRDVAITSVDGVSAAQTADGPSHDADQVRLWLVRSGAWALGSRRNTVEHTVVAGHFLLRHAGRMHHFALPPHTRAQCIVLPAAPFSLLLGGREVAGRADAAEVRLLVAHATMVEETLPDLSPAGVQAARDTLVELATAVTHHGFDDVNTRLAPALAQAAKNLAEERLADIGLSSAMLARELNVSVRTLQRAFAAGGESVTAYIRERRLESARQALVVSRLTVSEVAAHWQFADSSHFSRAFKQRYGLAPTEYVRKNT
ncbi:helix-turn-helix transcriptional regulator [Streptomyces phaeochromogenes]|uniref:AraC family transcriptional regulator n=1 Tax=Streptomyces phaeochromogenes TaxID=1923 RepID=UPI003401FE41|nr:helix-turn-helix transcriptional regulator [Streptomyces phaeochromogenes]WTA01449.1 helix-turn-helix transcriptional regulator [Streptomyces phaeochromogenes]